MSFQWIVDNAETMSINNLKVVAQTQARDGQIRAVTRGATPKKFEFQLPRGPQWSEYKDLIAAAEALDRFTEATITIPYSKFPWFYGNTQPLSSDSYTVICTDFPQWTIFQRDLIQWSGPFRFVEVL